MQWCSGKACRTGSPWGSPWIRVRNLRRQPKRKESDMAATAAAQNILDAQKKTWNAFAPGWNKWDDYFMKAIAPMGEALLAAVDLKPGHRVLDVATGTGEPGLTAAARIGAGEVIGIDISEAMVALARN